MFGFGESKSQLPGQILEEKKARLMENVAILRRQGNVKKEIMVRVMLTGDILDLMKRELEQAMGPLGDGSAEDMPIDPRDYFGLELGGHIASFLELADQIASGCEDGFDQAYALAMKFREKNYE